MAIKAKKHGALAISGGIECDQYCVAEEGCSVTALRVVSHVVLTSCGASERRMKGYVFFFCEGMRQRSSPRVASVVLLRA